MTLKNLPWSGWSSEKPSTHQRTIMKRNCGKKCFLGPKKSFPICKKNTCKISDKGIYAAYVRAREWRHKPSTYLGMSHPKFSQSTYRRIATRAKRMLTSRGQGPRKTLKLKQRRH